MHTGSRLARALTIYKYVQCNITYRHISLCAFEFALTLILIYFPFMQTLTDSPPKMCHCEMFFFSSFHFVWCIRWWISKSGESKMRIKSLWVNKFSFPLLFFPHSSSACSSSTPLASVFHFKQYTSLIQWQIVFINEAIYVYNTYTYKFIDTETHRERNFMQ